MLLGMWGPFALGKTTALNAFMCRCIGDRAFQNVVFVFADLNLEYHMDRYGQFRDRPGVGDHWKGTQEVKRPRLHDMIADDRTIWVLESARYFSGLYDTMVEAHNLSDGGLRFIVPVTDGPTMIKFMRARCALHDKEFKSDYWTLERSSYEAGKRYTNPMERWFRPNGIPYQVVQIGESRKEFFRINGVLDTWLRLKPDDWYGIAHSLRVYAGVPEDVEIERQKPKGGYRQARR